MSQVNDVEVEFRRDEVDRIKVLVCIKVRSRVKPHLKAVITVDPAQAGDTTKTIMAVRLASAEAALSLCRKWGDVFNINDVQVDALEAFRLASYTQASLKVSAEQKLKTLRRHKFQFDNGDAERIDRLVWMHDHSTLTTHEISVADQLLAQVRI